MRGVRAACIQKYENPAKNLIQKTELINLPELARSSTPLQPSETCQDRLRHVFLIENRSYIMSRDVRG